MNFIVVFQSCRFDWLSSRALAAGRDGVIDGNGADLDRRAAGRAHALHHPRGELPVVSVARHGSDLAVGDANLRPRQILVGKTSAFHHRSRCRAMWPVEQGAALASRIDRHDASLLGAKADLSLG